MARKGRKWYPFCDVHVMQRGNHKDVIFHDDQDKGYILKLFRETAAVFNYKIHAYCIMSNHYHFLLETSDCPLWVYMKFVDQKYSNYYNRKYHLVGHTFQGRYTECVIKNDGYFLRVSRYIHLNPVKARMVSTPSTYYWSSYREYIGMSRKKVVERDRTFSYFGITPVPAYRQFVEDKIGDDKEYDAVSVMLRDRE